MKQIVKTELLKLKRYSVLWAGVALMLLSILLTLFTSLAHDGTVWNFMYFSEQVIKNNMTTIFPMCITLIVGNIINGEQKDDTLKSVFTVPISFKQLLVGKLIVGGLLSLSLGIICAIFTIVAELIVKFPGFTVFLAVESLVQITIINLFLYIAVLPIIIITSKAHDGFLAGVIIAFVYGYCGLFVGGSKVLINIYPITASLGLTPYCDINADYWNIPLCALSMIFVLVISAVLVQIIGKQVELKKPHKKQAKVTPKKGW